MLRKGLYIIFCLLLAGSTRLFAQQDAQFTQYMFNHLYLTPAAAGADGVTRATAFHRSQWLGYQSTFGDGGAPTSQLISFSTPIHKLKSGFGVYVLNDRLGPQNNLEAQAMYAYHLGIKESSKLSFGIKLGMYSQTLDFDKYRAIDPSDPFLQDKTGKDSQIRPDLGVGLMFRNEKLYAGVGFNHLLKSEFDFGVSQRNALENHMNFTAGYFYDVNFDLQINPTVLVKTDFNETSVDLAVIATLRNTMWGGLAFRSSEAANLLLGYAFLKDKSLRLGYSVDFVIKDRAAKENFSHELMLSYELPVIAGGVKKIVRTPRYRH
ncbi:MAG TPA: type IX secretion system membrane protein PorP/SprF [Cyclobacteriaceae bacterium]|nr:type IX secretion system membrane protein PorP/SprF [Cyclobacteriaceae bacterium]HRJ80324.1 type IX secretion system membrane protein PorP/SprF [Cyclobacteriaceae bacterium]